MTTGILEKKLSDGVLRAEIGPDGWQTDSEAFKAAFAPKRDDWAGSPWVVAFWSAVDTLDADVVQEPSVEGEPEPKKMTESKPDREFSTTQLQVPHAMSKLLTVLANKIDPADLSDKGLEEDHHVTVLYGITDNSVPDTLAGILSDCRAISVYLNRASVFKTPEYDVLKINVDSGELSKLYAEISSKVPHENLHNSYVPHITIAYLKKGTGDKYTNLTNDLMGEPVRLSKLVFSSKDRQRTEFTLGGLAKFSEVYHGPNPPGDKKNWQKMPNGPRGGQRWKYIGKREPAKTEQKPAAKQGAKSAGKKTTPKPMTEKAKRAVAAHFMVDKDIQRYAESHNEPQFAKAVGGVSLPDNEPVDVLYGSNGVVKHGCELKTMVANSNNKITMDRYSQIRKHLWRSGNESTFHTVVIDDSNVYDAGGNHKEKNRRYFYRRGIAGSARIDNMTSVGTIEELKKLMAMPEAKLPDSAQPTDGWMYEGTWKPFQDSTGKGFKNSKSGDIVRAKK